MKHPPSTITNEYVVDEYIPPTYVKGDVNPIDDFINVNDYINYLKDRNINSISIHNKPHKQYLIK